MSPGSRSIASEAILRRYFGATVEGDIPTPIRDWLALEESARGRLEAEDGKGRRLSIRLVTHVSGGAPWRALLLDEWGLDPGPGELRALGLTAPEAEVLAWVARGKSDAAIGNLLSISPRTANKYLEHVYRKLGVGSRAEAVAKARSRLRG